jgi:hypothetical protein
MVDQEYLNIELLKDQQMRGRGLVEQPGMCGSSSRGNWEVPRLVLYARPAVRWLGRHRYICDSKYWPGPLGNSSHDDAPELSAGVASDYAATA